MTMALKKELENRLAQLENRKMMIPRYVENNRAWSGKNHYSLDMIPGIQKQIDETKAAIKGINEWLEIERQVKKSQDAGRPTEEDPDRDKTYQEEKRWL